MKVFITGIAGFIGFHLALSLKKKGYWVDGIDDFNDFVYDDKVKHQRSSILQRNGIDVHRGRIQQADMHLKNSDPDVVIHLAAHAGVRHSLDYPLTYIENNITNTQMFINACKRNNIHRVIYASTSCTMAGNPLPWKEDDPVRHQLNPYGYTKMANESQFLSSGLDSVGLRFFSVYGPWGRPDMALWKFCEAIRKQEVIEVFNGGNMKRDFTYVDDVVSAITLCAEEFDTCKNSIYNIGYGKQVDLLYFLYKIEQHFGVTDVVESERHPADTLETHADNSKMRQLGWEPKVSIDEGIEKFAEWYREQFYSS